MFKLFISSAAIATTLLTAATVVTAPTPIGQASSYKLKAGQVVLIQASIAPYFSANGLVNVPNPTFPNNLVLSVNGIPGATCAWDVARNYCANYRFTTAMRLLDTPISDAGNIYLLDMNQQMFGSSADAKGTAFGIQAPDESGRQIVNVTTIAASERVQFGADGQATSGLLTHLWAGGQAVNGSIVTFTFTVSPAIAGDITAFTLGGDPAKKIRDQVSIQVNSPAYPNMVNATIQSVLVK